MQLRNGSTFLRYNQRRTRIRRLGTAILDGIIIRSAMFMGFLICAFTSLIAPEYVALTLTRGFLDRLRKGMTDKDSPKDFS
jgi:hypothetical protein